MLEPSSPRSRELVFASELERYLRTLLHDDRIRLNTLENPKGVPVFLERAYKLYEAEIAGRRCVFAVYRQQVATPAQIANHIAILRSAIHAIVVFTVRYLSAYNRSRLIAQNTAFIVPGNQLYIPELAMDLREHFRSPRRHTNEHLSPAAQAVLFHHLLHPNLQEMTAAEIAPRLRYSPMTIWRAFEEISAFDLATIAKPSRVTHLEFPTKGRVLLESARPLLRSPVRATKYIRDTTLPNLKLAGETALSELTDLSPPHLNTYAIVAANWKGFADASQFVETDETEANLAIETWSYDPEGLSSTHVVDPLSLYAQFWNHTDERVAAAAEFLLENLPW